jgi:hypothetical protein
MQTLTIPQKSTGYYLNFTLVQSDKTPVPSLATYTIKLNMWNPGKPETPLITGTCVIVDASAGTIYYRCTATDFTYPGTYLATFTLTKTGVVMPMSNFQIIVPESGG